METSKETSKETYAGATSESVHFPVLERLGFLLKPEKIMPFLKESLWQNLLLISGRDSFGRYIVNYKNTRMKTRRETDEYKGKTSRISAKVGTLAVEE